MLYEMKEFKRCSCEMCMQLCVWLVCLAHEIIEQDHPSLWLKPFVLALEMSGVYLPTLLFCVHTMLVCSIFDDSFGTLM